MSDGDSLDRREFIFAAISACTMALVGRAAAQGSHSLAPQPVRFPRGTSRVRFPCSVLANAVFVPVLIHEHGPLLFALDTGSYNSIVASEIVAELGVHTKGSMSGMGSGSSYTMADIPSLEMRLPDGLVLATASGAAIPMAGPSALIARRFDGIVGADVLKELVVEIDYATHSVILHDPAHFTYAGRGAVLPFAYWNDYDPLVTGEITVPGQPPIPVRMLIDTGAGGTVLTTPFVNRHRLLSALPTLSSPDMGAGGAASVKHVARLGSLRIGPYTIDQPLGALSDDTQGTFAHADFDINLGGDILRRFNVIIDYPGRRLILEPNAAYAQPFRADASGLVLEAQGKNHRTFRVTGIVPGSPAADAGVQRGDVIAALDSRAARDFALWEVEDALKSAGATRTLTMRRGATTSRVSLRLRALL
jgi:PDZ domain/Aspartyl protease